MNFWIFFVLFLLIIALFKVYLASGVFQAFRSKIVGWAYAILSIGSLAAGAITMVVAYSDGIMNMRFWENFVISLMASVFICEVILAVFFFTDDLFRLFSWIGRGTKKLVQQSRSSKGWVGSAEERGTIRAKASASSAESVQAGVGIHHQDESRRRFLKLAGIGVVSLPFLSFLNGITRGKYNFRIFREELLYPDLPEAFDGLKIVQFSDLHSGGFDDYEAVKRGIGMIQEQNPDLILFTGDLVNDLEAEVLPYKSLLTDLNAPLGKFSVLGNHDYPQDPQLFPDEASGQKNLEAIKVHHADMGFQLLNNSNVALQKGNESIRLIGVENWGNGFIQKGDLDQAIQGSSDDEFSILMSHDPTHWEEKVLKHDKHIHLTLSGHTHGMQMGIELWGLQWSPVQYVYQYWAGLYKELGQYLYVNRGFGFMAFAGRVGIPPEVTVLTLRRA